MAPGCGHLITQPQANPSTSNLSIPATSAASERVFSAGGNIITKNRNRLSGETVRYLLCLRSWGVLPPPEEAEDDEVGGEESERE